MLHQKVRCPFQIKFSQTEIPEREQGHQALNIVISCTGQRFTVSGAVQMLGLTAVTERVPADLQNLIQHGIRKMYFCKVRSRITGFYEGNFQPPDPIRLIFRPNFQVAGAQQIKRSKTSLPVKGQDERRLVFLNLPAANFALHLPFRPNLQIACIDFRQIRNQFPAGKRRKLQIQDLGFFLCTGRNRRPLHRPDILYFFGLRKIRCPFPPVIASGSLIGCKPTREPAFIRKKSFFLPVFKGQSGMQQKTASALGQMPHLRGCQLYLRHKGQAVASGEKLFGKSVKMLWRLISADKISPCGRRPR